ncbi:MAG: NAD(P)H-binding protein [Rhodospirillaceae bacterium]|nr:NAD(P)H-binding protein [Rhodospirillaceae bacterium]
MVDYVRGKIRGVAAIAVLLAFAFTGGPLHAKEHVLIIGGAGNTGAALAKLLIARGDQVTAFVRPTTDRRRLDGVPVDYVVGDAMIADEVAAALEGKKFTVIIDTVQILNVTDQVSYTRLYANFVPLAKRMGVKQFLITDGGCSDWLREDCPLSPPLFTVATNMTIAEYILRGSGVPYTIFRIGALVPGGPAPDSERRTGTSYLTTDLTKFGGIWRGDLYDQIIGCTGAERCINKIFVIDDPTMKPQLDNWLCKRSYETDTINFFDPRCGEMAPFPVKTEGAG